MMISMFLGDNKLLVLLLDTLLLIHKLINKIITITLSHSESFPDKSFKQLKMSGTFQHYQHLRLQQIHHNKIINPELNVPTHQAYKPINPNIQQAKFKQRLKKQAEIKHQNQHIIKNLFTIHARKPQSLTNLSHSTKTFPPVSLKKKSFETSEQERQNNSIALRLIKTKSSIDVKGQFKDYQQNERLKKSLSRYQTIDGENGIGLLIDRKKYVAELMMLKKLKIAETIESRVKNYIESNPVSSRLSKINSQSQRSSTIKT